MKWVAKFPPLMSSFWVVCHIYCYIFFFVLKESNFEFKQKNNIFLGSLKHLYMNYLALVWFYVGELQTWVWTDETWVYWFYMFLALSTFQIDFASNVSLFEAANRNFCGSENQFKWIFIWFHKFVYENFVINLMNHD
jgi:hypothetical protein